jgi:hypothetical protein
MQIPDTQIHYLVQGASLYLYIGLHLALILPDLPKKKKNFLQCNHCFLFFRQSGRRLFAPLKNDCF